MSRTVVIAGGGPTGLMLACELGLMGVQAVVVEQSAEPATVSQGMAVHGRTLEVFRQRGLLDRIDPAHMIVWPRTPFALMWLDVSTVGEDDQTYAYPQWRTERLLEERARELGVEIRRGSRVLGFVETDDAVTVRVASDAGEQLIEAAYLVGCDGEYSTVRDAAGIEFPAEGDTYYGAIGDVPLTSAPSANFQSGRYPGGMFAVLPLQPGVARLMTVEFGRERPAAETPVTGDELLDSVERIIGERPEATPTWAARFGNHTRLADSYRKGRVFLAGDAAHVLFVSGTQGLNTGIQDAVNLGWKLAAAVHGWAPPGLLDSYQEERQPVGARVVRHARAQMGLLHPYDRVVDVRELFGEFLQYPSVHRFLLDQTTGDRYPMTSSSEDVTLPELLGRRIPDAALVTAEGPTTVAAKLRTGLGVLFDFTGDPLDVGGWHDRLSVVAATPTDAIAGARVLVRPDGIVAHIDPDGTDGSGIHAALHAWFGEPARDLQVTA